MGRKIYTAIYFRGVLLIDEPRILITINTDPLLHLFVLILNKI